MLPKRSRCLLIRRRCVRFNPAGDIIAMNDLIATPNVVRRGRLLAEGPEVLVAYKWTIRSSGKGTRHPKDATETVSGSA
jgi:hypothetical protein